MGGRRRGLDGVTALSGSGPAYVFLFLEALIAGGQKVGLTAEQARQLAWARWPGPPSSRPSRPSRRPSCASVSRPSGTTAAALASFSAAGFAGIVEDALAAAARRSRELAEEFGK